MSSLMRAIQLFLRPRRQSRASGLSPELARLVDEALDSDRMGRGLEELCQGIGARPNGSPTYDQASDWAVEWMRGAGLEGIRTEELRVPSWQRGEEWAELRVPQRRPLPILGLGLSVPTPPEGIEAELLVVDSLEALGSLPDGRVDGRIVLLNQAADDWEAWVRMRVGGASAAGRKGAVGVLVRAFAAGQTRPLRTGSVVYEFGLPKIPAAAISAADGDALKELGEGVKIHLRMGGQQGPDALARNVVGELPGWEQPEEVVLLTAHLDSWDVGQGAQDDGAGCLLVMEVARLLRRLNPRPRRTLRVLLSAGGVTGGQGLKHHLEQQGPSLARHRALVEVDGGSGAGQGFLWAPARGQGAEGLRSADLEGLRTRLAHLGADCLTEAVWGWDIESITEKGLPVLLLDQDSTAYLEVLHSPLDTFDSVCEPALRRNLAILALATHYLAETLEPAPTG